MVGDVNEHVHMVPEPPATDVETSPSDVVGNQMGSSISVFPPATETPTSGDEEGTKSGLDVSALSPDVENSNFYFGSNGR